MILAEFSVSGLSLLIWEMGILEIWFPGLAGWSHKLMHVRAVRCAAGLVPCCSECAQRPCSLNVAGDPDLSQSCRSWSRQNESEQTGKEAGGKPVGRQLPFCSSEEH